MTMRRPFPLFCFPGCTGPAVRTGSARGPLTGGIVTKRCVLVQTAGMRIITPAARSVIETKDLFTFVLDMGEGKNRMSGEQLESMLFNCLDFAAVYRKQPHFYLSGDDAVRHPLLWEALEVFRQEGAAFTILSGPEQGLFRDEVRIPPDGKDKIIIHPGGEAFFDGKNLGNMLQDRLADMLILP